MEETHKSHHREVQASSPAPDMERPNQSTDSGYPSPLRLLVILAVCVFWGELLVMHLLSSWFASFRHIHNLLDALLLTLLLFPALYLFL